MHKITEIIDNQSKYKDEIYNWFSEQVSEAKQDLKDIKTNDKFIEKEKKKLENKFKKIKVKNYLKRLFFLDSKRNEDFYVWWNETQGEAVILSYGKK
jgi:hypothetical protein